MIGTTIEPGIMFRTVEEIFAGVAEPGEHSFTVTCTFVEVYNENLRDLGSGDCKEGILDLREDPVTGTYVAGITGDPSRIGAGGDGPLAEKGLSLQRRHLGT